MAVQVRLGARGVPARMAAACFGIATDPRRAFGGWDHRVTSSLGTVPQAASGPPTAMAVPPGPTPGHSGAVKVFLPQWSIIRPSFPRVLPWAGHNTHGIPGRTYTPAVGQPGPDLVFRPKIKPRGPIAQGRVTTAPKPMFRWKRQGG